MRKPPTGEPCAGKPPARFGGRGGREPFPTPMQQVQELLETHARDGWELVTAFQGEGAGGQAVDPMVQSLSNMTNTIFIFKRAV